MANIIIIGRYDLVPPEHSKKLDTLTYRWDRELREIKYISSWSQLSEIIIKRNMIVLDFTTEYNGIDILNIPGLWEEIQIKKEWRKSSVLTLGRNLSSFCIMINDCVFEQNISLEQYLNSGSKVSNIDIESLKLTPI